MNSVHKNSKFKPGDLVKLVTNSDGALLPKEFVY